MLPIRHLAQFVVSELIRAKHWNDVVPHVRKKKLHFIFIFISPTGSNIKKGEKKRN